jgi:hypothetical protein
MREIRRLHRWLRLLLPLAGVCAFGLLSACNTTDTDKPKTADAAATKKKPPTMPDQNGDMAFQAFLSRLRRAIAAHDLTTIAGMMTTDFGYRLDPPAEGDGVFAYWDQNNVWPELELVINEAFVPKENYMVAPPEFVTDEAHYTGYRAGIRLENGSWKFAYFVTG